MNCTECKEKLVELLEGLLPDVGKRKVEEHLNSCEICRAELQQLKELNERLIANRMSWQKVNLENDVLGRIVRRQNEKLKQAEESNHQLRKWRKIMNSKLTKLAAAAVIVLGAVIGIGVFQQTGAKATAAEILQEAIEAVSDIWSVHMKAQMRTLPNDNFSFIGLELDMQKIEMWKRTDEAGILQWRVEKSGRVLLMDGQKTTMLIRPNSGVQIDRPCPLGCFDSWMGRLLNVQDLLGNELQKAKKNSGNDILLLHKDVEGEEKIVLEVEVAAGVPEDDYVHNKFIIASDHLKIYQFDAKTKLLEKLEIYVRSENEDVLIFEITDIEYNSDIDESVFVLDLPEKMNWYKEPEKLANNEKYEQMTPKEMARTFFQACADEDWDEALKFMSRSRIDDNFKKGFGGLKIISIGEPFQSKGYARGKGWFVPYEIEFRPVEGVVRLSKDNAAGRFVMIDGNDLIMGFKGKWDLEPEVLTNNDYYAKLSADEVVRAYYEALREFDFDEMKKFMPEDHVSQFEKMISHAIGMKMEIDDLKAMMPVVEIVSTDLSEDGKTAAVKILQKRIKKFNLAVRNDNKAKRYMIDGGL